MHFLYSLEWHISWVLFFANFFTNRDTLMSPGCFTTTKEQTETNNSAEFLRRAEIWLQLSRSQTNFLNIQLRLSRSRMYILKFYYSQIIRPNFGFNSCQVGLPHIIDQNIQGGLWINSSSAQEWGGNRGSSPWRGGPSSEGADRLCSPHPPPKTILFVLWNTYS